MRADVGTRAGRPPPPGATPRHTGRWWDLHLVRWRKPRLPRGRARFACNLRGSCCSDGGPEPRRAACGRRSRPSGGFGERERAARGTTHHALCPAMLIFCCKPFMTCACLTVWDLTTQHNGGHGRTGLAERFPKPCRSSSNSKGRPNASGPTAPTSGGAAMQISGRREGVKSPNS